MLVKRWSWVLEGIKGTTAVLLTEQVGHMDDAALHRLLETEAGLDLTKVTMKRGPVYTFVNFNFEVND
jgi:hypothetical protein